MPSERRRIEPSMTISLAGGEVEVADVTGDPDRAPLLFLHEGLGCVTLWRDFPLRVAEATGRRVLAYSRYGYGGSGPVRLPRRPSYMHTEALEALPELVERLALEAPILVGHSDGASIALIASGARALDPTALAVIAPHVIVEQITVDSIEGIRGDYLADGDLRSRLARYHRDPDMAFWGWNDIWLSEAFRSWDIRPVLRGVSVPVVGVQGTADPYGSLVHVETIEAEICGPFTPVFVEGAGHAPHLERPDEVVAALAAALAPLG